MGGGALLESKVLPVSARECGTAGVCLVWLDARVSTAPCAKLVWVGVERVGVGVGGVRVDTLLGPEGTRELLSVVSPGRPGR